jgi:glycosyltransferase involved in cell wall biosynthesis
MKSFCESSQGPQPKELKREPKVTILLPVHNGEAYLGQSIQTVLAQDFADFELLIIDDDSSDSSSAIAQSTQDQRVRYCRNPERYGLFKTLNAGIEEARSPLIKLWAQDDCMLPGSLGSFVDFAMSHPSAGMIYSDFIKIDERGNRTGDELRYLSQRQRTPELAGEKISALLFWFYGCLPGNISTVLLRREAWEKAGRFTTGRQQAPDFEMWVRISEYFDIGFIQEKLIELRDHSLQLSRLGFEQLTVIEEELEVIQALRAKLHPLGSESALDRIWVTRRGYQHVHWLVKSALRGDLQKTLQGWRAIKRYGHAWQQLIFWLVSMNGRYFAPDRDELFDSLIPFFQNAGVSQSYSRTMKEMS